MEEGRVIRSIADLPFRQKDLRTLLDLDEPRTADPDFTAYGYARARSLHLETGDRRRSLIVEDVLVLALHCAEDPEEITHDIVLEFYIPEIHEGYSVSVLLSDFLAVWLPLLRRDERAIVLLVCNPRRVLLAQPASAGNTPVYHGLGEARAWLKDADESATICLVAEYGWRAPHYE
jgi:hypothetical protein